MIKRLPLVLFFCSLPAFAAPQLTTEIQAGNVWVKGGVAQTDIDYELKNPSNGASASSSASSDSLEFSSLIAIDTDSAFTPILNLGFSSDENDDENVKIFSGAFGFVKKTASNKNIGMLINYDYSDDADLSRGSIDIATAFQTTIEVSKNYNEVFIQYSMPKDEGGIEGGRSLTFGNNFKMQINPEIDFVTSASLGIINNLTYLDDDSTLDYDPIFSLGGELFVNLDSQFSLSFSVNRGFGGGTLSYTSGDEIDVDIDLTLVTMNLIGRF